jgi:hypothetical protein
VGAADAGDECRSGGGEHPGGQTVDDEVDEVDEVAQGPPVVDVTVAAVVDDRLGGWVAVDDPQAARAGALERPLPETRAVLRARRPGPVVPMPTR